MLELLPPYLREYAEMKEIMSVEGVEVEELTSLHNRLVDNRYITTSDELGIGNFERVMNITPLSNDTLEDRRLRCLTKWNQKLPYNYAVLQDRLSDLCGEDGYELTPDFTALTLDVKLALGVRNQFTIVKNMLNAMVPCNVVVTVDLMHNTNSMLYHLTHGQMAAYTHEQLREDIL